MRPGTFNISSSLEPRLKSPLDARQIVDSYAALIDPSTWIDIDGNVWLYNGAIVGVANDIDASLNGIYFLLDADNYTLGGSWVKSFGSGGETTEGENVGIGDASVFYTKVGNSLRFRTIKAGYSMRVDTSNDIITIDASNLATYNSLLDPSLEMLSAVGGYDEGTTVYDLLGSSFTTFVDNLLFPTVYPTYVAPNNTFADNASSLQEIGASISVTYTSTFSRGQILMSGDFQDYRSGLPVNYNYTDPSADTLLIDTSSASLSNIQTVNGYLVTIGTQTWGNTVDYNEGPQPLDNKGNPYDLPLPAGTTSNKTVSFEGVCPLFGTTVNITTYTQQTLVSMLTGNNVAFSMVAETGGNKQTFDIPNAWTGSPTNRPLIGVQTYNTVSLAWEYQGGSAVTSLTYWTTSATTHSVQGNTINYTRYVYNGTDRSSVQVRLVF